MTLSDISPLVHRSALALGLLSVAVFLSGCSGDGYSGPTGTVSGSVTIDGAALSKTANVSFINTKEGFTASGQTDGSGNFSLLSNQSPEIPVGTYQVAVTSAAEQKMSPEAAMQASMESEDGSMDSAASAIPAKYGSPASSGLSFEVKEGVNSFELPLTSK